MKRLYPYIILKGYIDFYITLSPNLNKMSLFQRDAFGTIINLYGLLSIMHNGDYSGWMITHSNCKN